LTRWKNALKSNDTKSDAAISEYDVVTRQMTDYNDNGQTVVDYNGELDIQIDDNTENESESKTIPSIPKVIRDNEL
jgi:hypothetical protein